MAGSNTNNSIKPKDIYYNFSNQTPVAKKDQYGKDTFLKILSAQLSNQDPMNSKDNTEYVAQMAQFSALEQMQNLNTSMTTLLKSQKMSDASSLINSKVTINLGEGQYSDEIVKAVKTDSDKVYLVTENGDFNFDQVVNIVNNQNNTDLNTLSAAMNELLKAQKFTEGTMYLNAEVEFKLDNGNIIKDIVKGVKVDNGKVMLVTDNNTYNINQVVGVGETNNGK